jgi:hypothetical protein
MNAFTQSTASISRARPGNGLRTPVGRSFDFSFAPFRPSPAIESRLLTHFNERVPFSNQVPGKFCGHIINFARPIVPQLHAVESVWRPSDNPNAQECNTAVEWKPTVVHGYTKTVDLSAKVSLSPQPAGECNFGKQD